MYTGTLQLATAWVRKYCSVVMVICIQLAFFLLYIICQCLPPKITCLCSVSINLYAVGAGLCIKIADFGLAQKINKSFKIEEGSVLPVRSMAPECFITGEFTTASDIW